jgi:hypothetical protein
MMQDFTFQPGMSFQSNARYHTDQARFDIFPEQTTPQARCIYAEAVPAAFVLRGLENVEIDLGGAELMFHDRILPFVIENCRNVTLRHFTVNYSSPNYTQADILEADQEHLKIRVCEGYPYVVEEGRLVPCFGARRDHLNRGFALLQPFDKKTRSPAYNAGCILAAIGEVEAESKNPPLAVQQFSSEYAGNGCFIWRGKVPASYKAGQALIVLYAPRSTPGIYSDDCEDLVFEDIRMKRVAGFGIHSYFSRNITVRRLILRVDDDSDELVSINADGVHCIGCTGEILLEDCVLENMIDDGGNFHGYFTPIKAIESEGHRLVTSLDFPGGDSLSWHKLYRAGDEITVYEGKTMAVRCLVHVRSVEYPDDLSAVLITDEDPVLAGIELTDHLENHDAMPEITIRRCRTGRNRPRGFLISTWKKTLIEDCYFNNCSVGVHFTGDNDYWFESGPVGDVTIRNNIFKDCGYCSADSSIAADPHFEPCAKAPCYHKNIKVIGNTFDSFNDAAMHLNYCEDIVYRDNVFIRSDAYPRRAAASQVILENCRNADIRE